MGRLKEAFSPEFSGETYVKVRDRKRLAGLVLRVCDLMLDHQWRSLAEISGAVGGSEAGVSARLRDLRKPSFGGYTVERKYIKDGLWLYRIAPPVSYII